jgi:hypothetical protein
MFDNLCNIFNSNYLLIHFVVFLLDCHINISHQAADPSTGKEGLGKKNFNSLWLDIDILEFVHIPPKLLWVFIGD